MLESDTLFAELEPLLAGSGLTLVEFSARRRASSASAKATVYAPSGTGTGECAAAHRLIYPRLEAFSGTEDVELEVASPGIDRALKEPREWSIFAGRAVKALLVGEGEWIRGRILRVEGGRVVLACAQGERALELSAVAKARLDSSQEGD